jgi:hypothetical protein
MWAIDWSRVSADDFEVLISQLLSYLRFSNIEWFRGPGDRGRDVVATTETEELPGRAKTIKWIIECKRRSEALSPSDLSSSLVWVEAHQPDRYLLVTNAWLTPDTRDWIAAQRQRLGIDLQFLEGTELEQQLQRYEPPKYLELLERQVGLPAPLRHAELQSLSNALVASPDASPLELRDHLEELLVTDAPEAMRFPVSLDEVHELAYMADGMTKSQYDVTVANVSHAPIDTATFRIYADDPLVNNDTLNLHCENMSGAHAEVRFDFDNGYVKLLTFKFPDAVPPLGTLRYRFAFDWPIPQPIAGPRHYSTFGLRPKARVTLKVSTEDPYRIRDVLPLSLRDGVSRKAEADSSITLLTADNGFTVARGPLRYREHYLTTFSIYER